MPQELNKCGIVRQAITITILVETMCHQILSRYINVFPLEEKKWGKNQ